MVSFYHHKEYKIPWRHLNMYGLDFGYFVIKLSLINARQLYCCWIKCHIIIITFFGTFHNYLIKNVKLMEVVSCIWSIGRVESKRTSGQQRYTQQSLISIMDQWVGPCPKLIWRNTYVFLWKWQLEYWPYEYTNDVRKKC